MNERLLEGSVFNFQCQCCGTCCKSDLDIFLNTLDVWNLRCNLNMTTTELLDKYLVLETRPEYGLFPFCLMRMREGGFCPFIKDNLCSVHHARPAGCRFFPVAQFYNEKRESAFAMSRDLKDCRGRREKKQYELMSWLIVNKYFFYTPLIEFVPELFDALNAAGAEFDMEPLFNILYNFDSVDGFPSAGVFPTDSESGDLVVEWVISTARRFLAGHRMK